MDQSLLDAAKALNGADKSAAGGSGKLQEQLRALSALPSDQQRAAVQARDSAGRSALHHASEAGAVAVVEALLRAADGGSHSSTSAAAAASASAAAAAPSFSAHQLASAQDGQGQTSLHLALKAAADERKSQGSSSAADSVGHLRCAHLLLDVEEAWQKLPAAASANVSTDGPAAKRARVGEDGAAAASADAQSAAGGASLLSLRDSFMRLPLHWAVTSGSDSILLRCLSLGGSAAGAAASPAPAAGSGSNSSSSSWGVSSATRSGDTALHWACADGRLSAVDLLLSGGADPLLRNARDELPEDLSKDQAILGAIRAWKQQHEADSAKAAAATAAQAGTVGAASSVSTTMLSATRASTGPSASAAGKKKIAIKLKK